MNLCIDIGNSRTKAGIFQQQEPVVITSYENAKPVRLSGMLPLENIQRCIISSTIHLEKSLLDQLQHIPKMLVLDEKVGSPGTELEFAL